MKQRNHQQGFTLIELMIVVAIIGILASIAIPAYQDYTNRAKVTEAINLMSAAKTGVAEFYDAVNRYAVDNGEAGVAAARSIVGEYVTTVTVLNGRVTAEMKVNAIPERGEAKSVILSPTVNAGSIEWVCKGGGAMKQRYLPANCRDTS